MNLDELSKRIHKTLDLSLKEAETRQRAKDLQEMKDKIIKALRDLSHRSLTWSDTISCPGAVVLNVRISFGGVAGRYAPLFIRALEKNLSNPSNGNKLWDSYMNAELVDAAKLLIGPGEKSLTLQQSWDAYRDCMGDVKPILIVGGEKLQFEFSRREVHELTLAFIREILCEHFKETHGFDLDEES